MHILRIRRVQLKFYVLVAFYFKCQAWIRGEKWLFSPVAAKPLWTKPGWAIYWVLGWEPQLALCPLAGCSTGEDSVYIDFVYTYRLYVTLFIHMYTYICVWRERYNINFPWFFLVVLCHMDGYDQQFEYFIDYLFANITS